MNLVRRDSDAGVGDRKKGVIAFLNFIATRPKAYCLAAPILSDDTVKRPASLAILGLPVLVTMNSLNRSV